MRLWLLVLGIVGAVACASGGQTGDPGDHPGATPCRVDANCAAVAQDALDQQRAMLAGDAGAVPEGELRSALCRSRTCTFILVVDGACYVAGSAEAHDCSLSDQQILTQEGR